MHTMLRRAAILFILFGVGHAVMIRPSHAAPPTPPDDVPATARGNTIEGTVRDPFGQPLGGASITLRETLSGRMRAGAVSDAEGRFSVGPVAQGTYRLRISFVGFNADVRELSVGTTPSEPLEITLATGAFEQPELVVTASRAQRGRSAVTTSQLTRADFERLPDVKDLPVQLATLPAVTFHSENGNGIGYTTLRMRGFSERRMAVSINGIPQNDPEEFIVYWINFFDLQDAIQDIQVQRGVGAARFGPTAIGGAVNIVAMPYAPDPYVEAKVGYGSFGTRRASIALNSGLQNNRWVAFGRLARLQTDGYRNGSWSQFWRYFAGLTYYGDRHTITLQTFGGPQQDGLAYAGIERSYNKAPVRDESGTIVQDFCGQSLDRRYNYSDCFGDLEQFQQPRVELHHDVALSKGWTLKQAAFWIQGVGYFDFEGTWRSAAYLRLPTNLVPLAQQQDPLYLSRPSDGLMFRAFVDQHTIGYLPRLLRTGADGSKTTLGLEARRHRSLRWGRIQSATFLSEPGEKVYHYNAGKSIASAFAIHEQPLSTFLRLEAEVQATWRTYHVENERFFGNDLDIPFAFINPRLGLTLNPDGNLTAYASLARAQREPRLKSLYDGEEAGAGFTPRFETNADGSFDVDRPLVRPETVWNLEVGSRYQAPSGYVQGNVYWMQFEDEIVPSGGIDQYGVPRSGNAERTEHLGVELEGAWRLSRSLAARGHASLSAHRFLSFDEALGYGQGYVVRDGNTIAGFPGGLAHVSLTYDRGPLQLGVQQTYTGEQYIDNSEGTNVDGTVNDQLRLDAYTMLDITLRYRPSGVLGGITFSADLNNALDQKVLTYGNIGAVGPQFFPAATRHIYLGMSYRF